jgi:hypothetical protein
MAEFDVVRGTFSTEGEMGAYRSVCQQSVRRRAKWAKFLIGGGGGGASVGWSERAGCLCHFVR